MPMILLLALITMVASGAVSQSGPPLAHRGNHVDIHHGVRIPDPYRWMEDMGSKETTDWVRAQDEYARRLVGATPERDSIRSAIARIADVTRYSVPQPSGDALVYTRGDASFTTRWLLREQPGEHPRVLVDPSSLSADGSVRLGRAVASDDGRYVAYSVSEGQSRWETWKIREIATGRDLPDELTGLNSGASTVNWTRDGSGLYYDRLDLPAAGAELTQQLGGQRLFFHRVGTPQSADRLVFDPGEDQAVAASVTRDGRYLVVTAGEQGSSHNSVFYRDLSSTDARFVPLIPEADATYSFVGNDGPSFWLYTTHDAPRGRVIAVDSRDPRREAWHELIPEAQEVVDSWILATAVGERIVVGYRRDAWLAVKVFDKDGGFAYELDLSKVGSIWSFAGWQGDPIAYYVLSDFTDPGTVYRLDVRTGETTEFRRPSLAYDPSDYLTRQVFFEGRDGTRIPMFLTHRRDLDPDVPHPTFMYGYGAFNWAASPWFQPHVTAWLQMGGVYALPNIRGGGEYGEEWHQAGIRQNKQTSIDDYIAAAEWLIANGYSSSELLVANGGSASGPLVGAAITQRPDLFGASVIDFPALDMLRLEAFTGGRAWRSDFGTVEDPDDFRALLAYSPYHQVREGTCYPATLVAPGERDESTVPMHAYKFVAALQHAQACDRPILLRVSWGAGHTFGATPEASMDNWADQIAFLRQVLSRQE